MEATSTTVGKTNAFGVGGGNKIGSGIGAFASPSGSGGSDTGTGGTGNV